MKVYTQDVECRELVFEMPKHNLGLMVEIGGRRYRLTEEDGHLVLNTPDGRFVTHHQNSNTFRLEIVKL